MSATGGNSAYRNGVCNLKKWPTIRTLLNETSNHPKSPTVSLGIQKMAMFAQTQEPPFDDDLPTSVHTAGVDRGEVEWPHLNSWA